MTFEEVQEYIKENHQIPPEIMMPDMAVKGVCGIGIHHVDDDGVSTIPCIAILRECECCENIHAQLIPVLKDVLDQLIPQLIAMRKQHYGTGP